MSFLNRVFILLISLHAGFVCQLFSLDDTTCNAAFTQVQEAQVKPIHLPDGHSKESVDISQIDPVLSAECEPLTTVGQCVNVVSGHFFQIEKDIVSHSIEPLNITRCYDSSNMSEGTAGLGFGMEYPIWASEIQESARHYYALVSEREGAFIPYRKGVLGTDLRGRKVFRIDPRLCKKRTTNLNRTVISGCTNFVNWQAIYRAHANPTDGFWTIISGDGSQRTYGKEYKLSADQRRRLNFPTKRAYALTKEVKPNGNQLHYQYELIHDRIRLTQITAKNRTEKGVLDQLFFKYSDGKCEVTNGSGMSVTYAQTNEKAYTEHDVKVLTQVDSLQKGISTYHTTQEKKSHRVIKIEKPEGHFLAVQYEPQEQREAPRVARIYEPRGLHNETVETYRFQYEKNSTLVLDALKQFTKYDFDDNQRLSTITYLDSYHC